MTGAPGLALGRTLVMGIVNVTADSFSDGGLWLDPDAAVAHGLELVAEGADILDVGGESTRPGADRVPVEAELARVLPVVEAFAAAGVVVSVDTTRAAVADAALQAGATWVNDVSGGLADPAMLATVASAGAGYVSMHWRGHSRDMQARAGYADVVADVAAALAERRDAAVDAGIAPDRLVLDPGLGFAKTGEHNWEILRHWDAFEALGQPLLLAASRKGFLGSLLAEEGVPRPPAGRDDATATLTALFAGRAWAVRTHTVRKHLDAIRVVRRLAGTEA